MLEKLKIFLKQSININSHIAWLSNHLPFRIRQIFSSETQWRKRLLYIFASLFILLLWLISAYALILIPFTPGIADLKKAKIEQPTILRSADGKELMAYKRLNREWIKLERISPSIIDALIATEDHRFYRHHGIDFWRIGGAVYYTLTGRPQGGSTLTQQLARNLYPDEIGRSFTLTRKLKEAITAIKIEYAYSKKEILETYLNTVPFLYNAYGIEMASRTYFDKSAINLNTSESATLIGMLKGTSYYNPVRNPERSAERRNVVLAQMVKHSKLSQAKFDALKKLPVNVDFERQSEFVGLAPHFAEYIRKWLINWADRNDYNIYADGLMVYSTIDSRLQKMANQSVEKQLNALQTVADVEWGFSTDNLISTSFSAYNQSKKQIKPFAYFWKSRPQLLDTFIRETSKYQALISAGITDANALVSLYSNAEFIASIQEQKTRLESGFAAIDPRTGFVKAWVGSRDFQMDRYDHVAQARRQPGSTFKPFVYAAALEKGISPKQQYYDKPIEIRLTGGEIWRPSDLASPSGRLMTLEEGLIYSKNTITAQLMQEVGAEKVAQLAKKMGIKASPLDLVPSLALGTSPIALLEMISSYATIASIGEYRRPLMITKITDKKGKVLAEFTQENERALDEENAKVLIDIMRGVVNQGTGIGIRQTFGIRADVAGKTGTTQNNTDGWFILMHPQLVAGAWVGFNDSRVAMRSDYWGQGAHNALYVVGDFFRHSLNSNLVNSKAAFPRRASDSIFAPIMDQIYNWIDRSRGISRTSPSETSKPIEPEKIEQKDTGEEVDRAIEDIKKSSEFFQQQIESLRKMQEEFEKEQRHGNQPNNGQSSQ